MLIRDITKIHINLYDDNDIIGAKIYNIFTSQNTYAKLNLVYVNVSIIKAKEGHKNHEAQKIVAGGCTAINL